MNKRTSEVLKLTVTNPTALGGGATIAHSFTVNGGSIGTAANDTWQLSPHRTGAVAGHAEVRFVDGVFCLIDRSGRTFINSASQPVGRGRRARLNHGDTVSIGRYQIRAELVAAGASEALEDLAPDDDRLINGAAMALAKSEGGRHTPEAREPLEGLAPEGENVASMDPLSHWQQAGRAEDETETGLLASEPAWFAAEASVTDEYRENRDVAVGLPVRNPGKDRDAHRGMEGEVDRMSDTHTATEHQSGTDQSRRHISGAPLMRGMETGLDFADSESMQLFLEEAGQTLKATVEGLLALHQGEDSRHQALRTRLQPIEDNPLRLGGDYEATVQTLFASQRSPVHLSAPAAVRESLESLNHHQLATREAISEALDAILHAFSPEALLRRFHGYRRGLKNNEEEGRWAWDMYQHYYRELKSSRQQGFERLFQEVFDQAYDQNLRQLQRENEL
jgi:type VI secretion system protein ImpI